MAYSAQVDSILFAGLPAQSSFDRAVTVTTNPAPITLPSPIVTPPDENGKILWRILLKIRFMF
jgi:hypothetical protein